MKATYSTPTTSPTVYFTALNSDGSTLLARTTTGVTLLYAGSDVYYRDVATSQPFVARWDEGDPTIYTDEYVSPSSSAQTATVNIKRIFDARYQDVSDNVPIDFQ